MAVTYNVGVKTSRMTATRDYFVSGTLEILTAADVLIVAFTLTTPGGTVTGAAWTLAFANNTVAAVGAGSNTAAKAQIKRSAGNGGAAHLTGLTVGTSGTDVILDNLVIANGQNVTLSSAVITHAT